ncbi:hypothetical protein [Fodinibius halophilus]|nr:hypothetical protein [Fodinibius halophilus]
MLNKKLPQLRKIDKIYSILLSSFSKEELFKATNPTVPLGEEGFREID